MHDIARFETPENIAITYRLAGPGTRFVAFLFDSLLIFVALVLVFIALVVLAVVTESTMFDVAGLAAILVFTIGVGFVNIAYYGVFEWFMNGQTPGKRLARIRVVSDGGFSLTFSGVVIRNVFRLIDVIPLLWVVPVVTRKMQRFGDIVAGTIVVTEQTGRVNPIREILATRPASDAVFTFSPDQLRALRTIDVDAVERFLERRGVLHIDHRAALAERLTRGLVRRLQPSVPPNADERERFLEDVLAAYARRETRELS